MSVTDRVEHFICPTCRGPAAAEVRQVDAWQGTVFAVRSPRCEAEGPIVASDEVKLALGICPTCEHRMRRRRSIEQSVAGGDVDWYCDNCGAVRGDAN